MELFKRLFALSLFVIATITLSFVNNKNNVSNQIKKTTDDTVDLVKTLKENQIEKDLQLAASVGTSGNSSIPAYDH